MPTLAVRHLSISIDVPFERAYRYAREHEHFMEWAAGLANSLHKSEHGWVADTPEGEAEVLFSPPNDYGVLDHRVQLRGKAAIDIPLRMIANGDGTEVLFTLFRQPDMDDAAFERDASLVQADLAALKLVLERNR